MSLLILIDSMSICSQKGLLLPLNLIKFVVNRILPDCPSARILALPTTRKIAKKNKIVFGTGDHWRAPTVTANTGFVRAISQTGMSLLTIEHRPRALTGD